MVRKPELSLWRGVVIAAALVGILQTVFYVVTGEVYAREFRFIVPILSQNVVANFGVLAGLAILISLPMWLRLSRRSGAAWAVVPVGVALLAYVTLLRPINHAFFPYAFSPRSLLANAGLLLLFAAAAWAGGRAYRPFVRKASRLALGVMTIGAAAVVASSAAVTFQQPVRARVRELTARGYGNGPNVIIITIDALRSDYVSAYGQRRGETEHIDRFASRAMRFEHFYTASTYTPQSMMSMLTSTTPLVHGCDGAHAVSDSLPTLAEILRDHGYYTAGFVNNANLGPELGFGRGFDVYRVYGGRGVTWLRWTPVESLYSFFASHNPLVPLGNPQDEKMAEDVIAALARCRAKRPYFLWAHFLDPHAPLTPPRSYMPVEVYDSAPCREFRARVWDKVELYPFVEPTIITTQYRAEVHYVDDVVGRVLDYLYEAGAFKDTVIIVSADHGEELFDHGWYGHGHQVYEETALIPFLMYVPNLPPSRVERAASLLDVAPTLLTYVGVAPPPGMEGIDLMSIPEGEAGPFRHFVTVGEQEGFNPQGLRTGRYTYITDTLSGEEHLFRAASDPSQREDVGAREPEALAEMRRLLAAYRDTARRKAAVYGQAEAVALSKAQRDALKGLGYVR